MKEYYLAAFRSRAHTMSFFNTLKYNNIAAQIINTPRQASLSCGISVMVAPHLLSTAQQLVPPCLSLIGWFYVQEHPYNRHLTIKKI